jgi:hypothetical protein
MAAEGIICQVCGIEAPARQVEFHQNIGALVARFHRKIGGRMCKSCVHKKYWKMTGITLGVGWLGMISIVIAPIFIIMNTVQYLGALGMAPVPPGARVPVLDEQTIRKIRAQHAQLVARLNQQEDLGTVARDIAARTGVTPGQVVKYVAAISAPQPAPARAQGFPVVPLPQPAVAGNTQVKPPPLPLEAPPASAAPNVPPASGGGPDPLLPI